MKRGQVTVFVVIGILVIIAGWLLIFNLRQEPILSKVPVEHQPVARFIESCLKETSIEGLKLIGEHGGYLEELETAIPTESKAVDFLGSSVAYWDYMESENTCEECKFNTEMPYLRKADGRPNIEEEIEKHLNNRLEECFDEFKTIKAQGFEATIIGEMKPTVRVTENNVKVSLKLPVRSQKESTLILEEFNTDIDVNLKKIYELARSLTEQSRKEKFLEHYTINLISGFSGTEEKDLPSISDTRFDLGPGTIWQEQLVEQEVKAMLSTYIQGLMVEKSINYLERPALVNDYHQKLYDNMVIPESRVSDARGMKVEFEYLEWPIYFYMGCDGACEPESLTSNLGINFGLQRYNFVYDISYPVVVTIQDPEALKGDGYTFRFGLEANIRNNKALEGNNYALKPISTEASQLCDANKRTSGNITVKASDAFGNPIKNAAISYTCAGETCRIGTTNENGILNSKFPVCINGQVSAVKADSLGSTATITTLIGKSQSVNLVVPHLFKVNVSAFKKRISKTESGWAFSDSRSKLEDNEQLTISLKRIGKDNEQEYSTALVLKGDAKEEILLAEGDYEVKGTLLLFKNIVIPSERRCHCTAPVVCNEECFNTPVLDYGTEFPEGGLFITEENGLWHFEGGKRVEFTAIAVDLGSVPINNRKIEDAQVVASIDDYSNIYRLNIDPETVK